MVAQDPDLSLFYALPHRQKQGMIQAGDLQGAVQPNSSIFSLIPLQNWEPCNQGCKKVSTLTTASKIPAFSVWTVSSNPDQFSRTHGSSTLFIHWSRSNNTCKLFSKMDRKWNWDGGIWTSTWLIRYWSEGIFCFCVFLVVGTVLKILLCSVPAHLVLSWGLSLLLKWK